MPRDVSNLRRGGPGRPKGSKNKRTRELSAWVEMMRTDPQWQDSMQRRLRAGRAPHLEALIVRETVGEPEQKHRVAIEPMEIIIRAE